jgi:hypothetical protein
MHPELEQGLARVRETLAVMDLVTRAPNVSRPASLPAGLLAKESHE